MRSAVREIGRGAAMRAQRTLSSLGVLVVPNHYYSPVADTNELARSKASWARPAPMHGIEVDLDAQAGRLAERVGPFEPEYRGNAAFLEAQANGYGLGFGYVEAQCLHGVIRDLKPARILEIGSGVSTHCMRGAARRNAHEGRPASITCVEPYPSAFLRGCDDIELIVARVQDLDPAIVETLGAGDLLFIDTSHAVKPAGDVLSIYLDLLPRLRPGVVVQIHDIYFPYPYQRDLLDTLYQWTETALLMALLTNNQHLRILFSLSMLHYERQDALRRTFPEYEPAADEHGLAHRSEPGHFPSSIYLETY